MLFCSVCSRTGTHGERWHIMGACLFSVQMQVCLIGKSRTYPPAREGFMDEQRTRYINSRQGCPVSPPGQGLAPPVPGVAASSADRPDGHPDGHGGPDTGAGRAPEARATGLWLSGFHPREKAERVRNCAALPRDFIDQVVLQVARLLLGGKHMSTGSSQSGRSETWNRGGKCPHRPGHLLGFRQRLGLRHDRIGSVTSHLIPCVLKRRCEQTGCLQVHPEVPLDVLVTYRASAASRGSL